MNGLLILLTASQIVATLSLLPGGTTPIQQEDEDAVAAAKFAVDEMRKPSTSFDSHLVMTSLVEGTKQVVAGTKYSLKIKVARSWQCQNKETCLPDMTTAKCYQVNVLWQPWKKQLQYTLLDYQEATVSDAEHQFQKFVLDHQKKYRHDSKEYEKRLAVFTENLDKIATIQEKDQGTATYGVTEFADISTEEFLSHHAMPNGWGKSDIKIPQAPELPVTGIPSSCDWRKKGVVTAVKNQGSCGSCWAFSVTGNIEGQWAIHNGTLISLSEQELVDCDKVDKGCEGGLPSTAYKQIIKLGGLEKESDYPYVGEDMTCKFHKAKVVVTINGSVNISSDEGQMAAWLAAHGPISIGINAFAMQFYFGGIADPWSIFCNPNHLDHGVLIVGYGQDGDKPYWIIKNSWGSSWGEEGYYRIIRGKGKCGLNRMPTSATVA